MLKTHHEMRGRNRQFQYLPAKIIAKIVKSQYLPAKTIHFSLSVLTPLSLLSHTHLSPPFSWLWLHSQSLSVTLGHSYLSLFSWPLSRGLSSELINPPCVRPCVPLLGEAQNIRFCTILSETSKITYVFYSTQLRSPSKHSIKLVMFSANAQNTA